VGPSTNSFASVTTFPTSRGNVRGQRRSSACHGHTEKAQTVDKKLGLFAVPHPHPTICKYAGLFAVHFGHSYCALHLLNFRLTSGHWRGGGWGESSFHVSMSFYIKTQEGPRADKIHPFIRSDVYCETSRDEDGEGEIDASRH
jgi:hypothetical protein